MPPADALSLQQLVTRWIVLQKARRHRTNRLRLLVRTQFQDLFHSPSGVLLTFPSRYLYTIDRKIYLALEGGPSSFSQDFTCPDLLDNEAPRRAPLQMIKLHHLTYLAITVFGATFQRLLLTMQFLTLCQLVVALASFCRRPTASVRFPQKVICMSQPPNNIRLPTYPNCCQLESH